MPVYLWAAIMIRPQLKTVAFSITAWIVGASGYLIVFGIQLSQLGWAEAMADCLWGRQYGAHVFNVTQAGSQWMANLGLMALTFFSLVAVLGGIGFLRCVRGKCQPVGRYLAAIAAIEFLFVIRYSVPDQFTFALPTWLCVAILAGMGGQALMQKSDRWRRILPWGVLLWALCQPIGYVVAYSLAHGRFDRPTHSAPRDEAALWILPWKHTNDSAQQWVDQCNQTFEPTAWIVTDNTAYYPLQCDDWQGRVFTQMPSMNPHEFPPLYWTTRYDLPDGWRILKDYPALRLRRIVPVVR
jgi:hypothetical protein